jgi:hypothetical protein
MNIETFQHLERFLPFAQMCAENKIKKLKAEVAEFMKFELLGFWKLFSCHAISQTI